MYKKCVKIANLITFMSILAEMTPLKRLCNMACNNSVTLIMNKILISTEGPSFILWHKSIYGETNKTSQKYQTPKPVKSIRHQNQSKVSVTKTSQKYQTPKPVKSIKSSKPIISSQYLSNPM